MLRRIISRVFVRRNIFFGNIYETHLTRWIEAYGWGQCFGLMGVSQRLRLTGQAKAERQARGDAQPPSPCCQCWADSACASS